MAEFNLLDPSTWISSETPTPAPVPANAIINGVEDPGLPLPGSVATPPVTSSTLSEADILKASLAQINAGIKNPDVMAAITLSEDRGNSFTEGNSLIDDYATLSPVKFQQKHGQDIYDRLVATGIGGREIRHLAAAQRDPAQMAGDTAVQAANGFNQGLISLADIAARYGTSPGPVQDWLLQQTAGMSKAANERTHRLESEEMGDLRYVDAVRAELDKLDNKKALETDKSDDEAYVDSLATFGRQVLREGYTGGKRLVEDPNMFGAIAAEGAGSMLLGGPTAKGISGGAKLLNNAIRPGLEGAAARAVDQAIERVSFPTAIGAMEGGGAAIQAQQEVLNMPEAELAQSPEYQRLIQSGLTAEAARARLASSAGTLASVPAALVGAATGKLVENIELRPFARTSTGGLVANAGKEAIEEGIQSGAGQLSVNAGIAGSGADPDRDLGEGVGEQAIQGAAGGIGTTGLTQGPGVALAASLKGTVATLGLTAKGIGATFKLAAKPILARGERIINEREAQSPVSAEQMAPAVQVAAENAPVVAEALRTLADEQGATGADIEAYIQRVQQASQIQEADLDIMPDSVGERLVGIRDTLGRMPNRFEALDLAADVASDDSAAQDDRVGAATFILKSFAQNQKLFQQDLPEFLEKVPHSRDEFKAFQEYASILDAIEQTPSVVEALKWAAEKMQMEDRDLSSVDLKSPEGLKIVNQAIDVATLAPQAVSLTVADQILRQANEGKTALSPEQRRILQGAKALKEAGQASPDGIAVVSRQIETEGGAKAHQMSLMDHVAGINQAVSEGDTQTAKARVNSLGLFARHMRNKVEALNTAIKAGDRKRVPYQSLGRDGWLKKDDYFSVFFNPGTDSSERLARQVHAEATTVAMLANNFAREYGIQEVTVPALAPMPAKAAAKSAQDANDKRGSSASEQPSTPQATTSRADDTSQEAELPLQPPKSTREPEAPTPAVEPAAESSTNQRQDDVQPAPVKEAAKIVEQVSKPVATEPEPEKTTEVTPAVEAEGPSDAEVVALLDEFDDPTPISQLKTSEAFPTLVQPKGRNFFHSAFRLPKQRVSRMLGLLAPLNEFAEALQNGRRLRDFMAGKDVKYTVDARNAAGLRELLSLGDDVLGVMKTRLRQVLTAPGKNGKASLLQRLNDGEEINHWRELRALNIMEKTEKGYRYNQSLVETAIIAGLDWALNATDRAVPQDRRDVADLLGIAEDEVTETQISEFNRGLSLDMAARSLAENIRTFWGVEAEKAELADFVEGIPEAVAKEILHGLQETGLLTLGINDDALAFPGVTAKKFNRVWFDQRTPVMTDFIRSLDGVSSLFSDMALIDRDVDGYQIGEPVTDVDLTQLRNAMVPTTTQQRQALENTQATPHHPNSLVFDFFEAMGLEAFVTLMSGRPYKDGDLDKSHTDMGFNKAHWESVKGLQRSLVASFTNVSKQMAAVKNYATTQGIPLAEAASFYKFHVNKLGRTQMAGLSNPQVDKFAREIFMPTRSKLDLSNRDGADFQKFLMTIGQGIGLKTEKLFRNDVGAKVIAETLTEGGAFRPLVQELREWLSNQPGPIPAGVMTLLTDAGLSMHGMHSLLAVASYELALERGEDLSQFETMTYLEADGKTNGPINALLLMASGLITTEWLKTIGKGGAYFGRQGKTLNSHIANEDSKDLYETGSDETGIRVAAIGEAVRNDSSEAHDVFVAFQRFLAALDLNVDLKDGELLIKRGITKNPLTITIYGSGETGIAGKVTDELLSTLYEKLSESIATGTPVGDLIYGENGDATFMDDLAILTSRFVGKNEDGKWFAAGKVNPIQGTREDFAPSSNQYRNLRGNIQSFLVGPMRAAIETNVTKHVSAVTGAAQQATQLQSIFLKGMFIDKVVTRLAMKAADPEKFDYAKGDFLSEKELEDIRKSLLAFSPIIDTGTQGYFLSGGEKTDLFEKTTINVGGKEITISMPTHFSRSLTGDMETPAYVYGPTLAGVKAIPTLVVGSGDGQMVLNFLAENPEAAKRVEHIFDGVDLPADAIDDYSRLVNEAVFKTWTSNTNPVRATAEGFKAFMARNPVEVLFGEGPLNAQQEQARKEITQVILERFKIQDDEIVSPADAKVFMEDLMARLSQLADETDARRRTYAEFPMSVDQMASAESPYVTTGSVPLAPDASYEDIKDAMNARYRHHLNEVKAQQAQPPVNEAIEAVGKVDELGARVVLAGELPKLFKELTNQLNTTQKEMMRNAVRLLEGSDYRIVFGTSSTLDAWEQANNADRYVPGDDNHYGKIDPVSKIIIISNMEAETVVHELVHAATIDKVRAFYRDPNSLSKEERDAVTRIEGLMNEWRQQDPGEAGVAYDARRRAEAEIEGRLSKNQKAEALNEFMAWVLGNQHLAALAQKTKVKNPLFRIVGDALAALKALIWGSANKGPRVGDSLLSNLRFNTRVLIAGPTQVELLQQDFSAVVLYQSKGFGTSDRLGEIRKRFNSRVIAWVKGVETPVGRATRAIRAADVHDARRLAEQVTDLFAWEFQDLGNMQAKSTFKAIQRGLMTEIELNPNALSRMEDLYAHVVKQLKYTDFMADPDKVPTDPNDEYQARQKYDLVLGKVGTVTDKLGRSSLLSSFLALATTSDQFRSVLAKMDKPKSDKSDAKGLDAVLENAAQAGIDRLSILMAGEKGKDANIRDALDSLMYAMIENVGDQRSFIEQRTENGFDKIETYLANVIQEKSAVVAEKAADVARNSKSRTVKAGASAVSFAATMINEQKATDAALGMVSWLNRREGWDTVKALVADLVGRTRENAQIFDMISKVRATVQQVRQQFRDELPVKLNRMFKKPVSKAQWTAMFKTLGKTDLASLVGSYGLDGALEMLTNDQRLTTEIVALERSIDGQNDQSYATIMKDKAKQLAHFMVTGEPGAKLLRNAEAIGSLLGHPGTNHVNTTVQLIGEIDRLATLYAIQETDQAARDVVVQLIQNEKEGVEFVTSYLIGQRVDELAKAAGNRVARFNHYKGHLPSETQQGGSLIIASDTEFAHLVSRGYTRVGAYTGSSADRVLGKRSYYFAPVSGRAPFTQGVLQTVHQTVSGVDPETGFTVGEVMAGRIDDPQAVKLIDRLINNQSQTDEQLLPVFDDAGRVVAFERAADPKRLVNLNRSTDLAAMIGVWRGRQAEEMLAQEVNKQLVDRLHEIWQQGEKDGRQKEFVNIAKLDPRTDDRILIEAANLIPNQTLDYMKSVFGPDRLMVRRDMLLDTFGARQASVGDLFSGHTRWNPRVASEFEKLATGIMGKNAYKVLVGSEKNIQEFVGNVRTMIVVKSVIVPAANLMANMFQLLNRGVPVRSVIHGVGAKTAEISTYVKRRAREIDLEADLRAAEGKNDTGAALKISNEIQSIRDSYKRMSIWPLIEAGEFSAISNGQVTAEDLALADGKWTDFIERKVNELKEPLRTPARYALVTRDTALFQGLARAVQYGDFVAKAVLYDDLVSRKKAKREDAIATVNEAFVNYNRLAGRGRQYLESVGLLWFYNYKLRIMKEAAYLLRHNPLRSLMMLTVPNVPLIGDIGAPVQDNILGLFSDGKLGYSIGPGMGLGSWQLNPWVNLAR